MAETDPVVEMARKTIAEPCIEGDSWTEAHVQGLARWVVQHAAIVAAAKAQEAAQRGHGRGTIGWSNACRATEFAVQAAQASSERTP